MDVYEVAQLAGSRRILSLVPQAPGQGPRDTHPLVVVHCSAGGADGEGGGGACTLTQGHVLLGFRPRNTHL